MQGVKIIGSAGVPVRVSVLKRVWQQHSSAASVLDIAYCQNRRVHIRKLLRQYAAAHGAHRTRSTSSVRIYRPTRLDGH